MHYFLRLASDALEGPLYAWRFTAILLLLIGITGGHNFLFKRARVRKAHLLLLLPLLLSLVVLVWGTIMAHPSVHRPQWSYYVLYLLCLLHLPLVAYLIYLMRDVRWFAVSVSMFALWLALCCSAAVILSGMTSN